MKLMEINPKKQEDKKQKAIEAFMKDHQALVKKHKKDFFPILQTSPKGIIPTFMVVDVQ